MAFSPSQRDLDYLWRPKKTLRDWGQTNYNIVRNWTPHHTAKEAQPTATTSKSLTKSQESVTATSVNKSSSKRSRESSTELSSSDESGPQANFQSDTSSYRLRRSTKKRATNANNTWYIPEATMAHSEAGPSTSRHLFPSQRDGDDCSDTNIEPADDYNCTKDSHIHSLSMSASEPPTIIESRNSGPTLNTFIEGLLSRSQDDEPGPVPTRDTDSDVLDEDEEHRNSPPLSEDTDDDDDYNGGGDSEEDSGTRSESETKESTAEDEPLSEADQLNDDGEVDDDAQCSSLGRSADADTPGPSQSRQENTKKTTDKIKKLVNKKSKPQGKTSKRGKQKAPSVHMKLWQPKNCKRTAKDLNELDVCLTVYDRVVREAVEKSDDEVVQRAMVSHWKGTQKHVMSVIKDLHTVMALEKRLKNEQTKHRHLQKEMLTVLKSLRRTNSEYQEAKAKTKEEKERQEALQVEAQVAAVGLLLRSNSVHSSDQDEESDEP